MEKKTPRNQKTRNIIIQYMTGFFSENGRQPTVREIGAAAGLSSTSTTAGYLNRMVGEGLLGKSDCHRRTYFVLADAEKTAG